ncbi:YuiB family protein [Calditerricola satsumensis]
MDVVILFFGLLGAACGGWAIRTLRRKGYRMF